MIFDIFRGRGTGMEIMVRPQFLVDNSKREEQW
jgi:hypothetical protein